ncbi:MAG: lipopolysaccharide kinase InaA family protein [Phycisphaerae bacterium]|nr:lipopolysaccharide kinase InaA family protein [Phycisphaerae bacterium]
MKTQTIDLTSSFSALPQYKDALAQAGLKSIDDVFNFQAGTDLNKANLAKFRRRIKFEISNPQITLFLKTYNHPPVLTQIKNWLAHKAVCTTAAYEASAIISLNNSGINTPKLISFGQQRGGILEKRSFAITEKIPDAESLEKKIPPFEDHRRKNAFINRLANFVRKFHDTGFRHRDLYLCHIFYNGTDTFYLIDLGRAFIPVIFSYRYMVKDLSQLNYSASKPIFSYTDRLRFLKNYLGKGKLTVTDKRLIKKILKKCRKMLCHDKRCKKPAPFVK